MSLQISPGEKLALVGENGAGKSSLMNVLYGLYQPDAGRIVIGGKPGRLKSPADALAQGIGMVHQHFTLVPSLTVAENVVLGREPRRGVFFDTARAEQDVAATCQRLGFAVDPRARVDTLSVGSQQKVEIVKALHRGVSTLILDEPTAVLTPQEAAELHGVLNALVAAGNTVVLISHKLKEVLAFATRVVVMRRGKTVLEVTASQTTADALAAAMMGIEPNAAGLDGNVTFARTPANPVGRGTSSALNPAGNETAAAPVIALENVHAAGLRGITLHVRAGEILGVAGVDGNGQRELAEVLTGLRPWTQGTLAFRGERLPAWNPPLARKLGVAHIPEDRLHRALAVELSAEENVSLGKQRQPPFAKALFGSLGLGSAPQSGPRPRIDFAGRRAQTELLLREHDVRPPDAQLRAGAFSGGNQQKLVVARELDGNPALLVAVQPTRGLDLGAVAAVQARLRAAQARGCAVVLISLDLDEVLALADRVVVMCGGTLNGEFLKGRCDAQTLGPLMLGA